MAIEIIGQGLAGSCLAWQLRWRGVDFSVFDDGREGAASRVAAGMVNPVTGKNFEPSWRLGDFQPEAVEFYQRVEQEVGKALWFPLPVVRLVSEKDWKKVAKKLERPEVAAWVASIEEHLGDWRAAVTLRGGGRLDVRAFCEATATALKGRLERRSRSIEERGELIYCEGAAGLMEGRLGDHRCAKGEILTLKVPGADEGRILVGGGGWMVPVGGGVFRAGATYEWEQLDGRPTAEGRRKVEEILARIGVTDFEVIGHEAGVRPIVRRSIPLIGRTADGKAVFNGLGSKGSLYAPGVSRRLAEWLLDGEPIEDDLDIGRFLGGTQSDG